MKTLIYFIAGITLNIFLLAGCTKAPELMGVTCPDCTYPSPQAQPTYEVLLERSSGYNGFSIFTATLNGDFIYPVIVSWYGHSNSHKLNKSDTLKAPNWNKSYYHVSAEDPYSNLGVDCEVTMNDGVIIKKSIHF